MKFIERYHVSGRDSSFAHFNLLDRPWNAQKLRRRVIRMQ